MGKTKASTGAKPAAPGKSGQPSVEFKARPFAQMQAEPALIALRELIPAASFMARTTPEYGDFEVQVCSLLPGMAPARLREDGLAQVGLQVAASSADLGHDLAACLLALHKAREAKVDPGTEIKVDVQGPAPELSEILVDEVAEVQIHEDVAYWFSPEQLSDPQIEQVLQQNRAELVPTVAVPGVEGAYWVDMKRVFVRFIIDEDDAAVLDGLARLSAARKLRPLPDSKFAGAFRTCGVMIPVWELPPGTTAEDLTEPLSQLREDLREAMASTEELSYREREARAGIINRQVVLK